MPWSSSTAVAGLLKAAFGSAHTSDFPATWYVALFDGDPEAGGVEPDSTGNYARLALTNNSTNFSVSGLTVTNLTDWVWPTSTAAYQTGHTILSHWAFYDNSAGGSRFLSGKILIAGVASTIVVNGTGLTPKCLTGHWAFTQGA